MGKNDPKIKKLDDPILPPPDNGRLMEDQKDFINALMQLDEANLANMPSSLAAVILLDKLLNLLTASDLNTLELLGVTSRRSRRQLQEINLMSNIFGHPALLDSVKREILMKELTKKGRTRGDLLKMANQVSRMTGEEKPRFGGLGSIFNRGIR